MHLPLGPGLKALQSLSPLEAKPGQKVTGAPSAVIKKSWPAMAILVGGLEHEIYFPFHIWDVILPIDEVIVFKMVIAPPTSIIMENHHFSWEISLYMVIFHWAMAILVGGLESEFYFP